jgi:hypothetical protein
LTIEDRVGILFREFQDKPSPPPIVSELLDGGNFVNVKSVRICDSISLCDGVCLRKREVVENQMP